MKNIQNATLFWIDQNGEERSLEGTEYYYDDDNYEYAKNEMKGDKKIVSRKGRTLEASESSFTAKRSRPQV